MPVTRIRDEFMTFTIDAEVIAGPVSTEYDFRGKRRVRWMEATLYLKADGTYVLHQVNRSRVWHQDGGVDHVRKPEERPYSQLPSDAVYCGDLPDRGRDQCPARGSRGYARPAAVITEQDQHKAFSFPDEAAVIRHVATAKYSDGTVSVAMSEPMRDLLAEAEERIPAFGTAQPVVAM